MSWSLRNSSLPLYPSPKKQSLDDVTFQKPFSISKSEPLETSPLLAEHSEFLASSPESQVDIESHSERNSSSQLNHFVKTIPAILLGVLLNLLDAQSYGIIIFPSSDSLLPSSTAQAGVCMFLTSTIISQLVYTFGGSKFKGAIGSMMIEIMPFLHTMCKLIENRMSEQSMEARLSTIMFSYALSTIMTGFVFMVLGYFRLGDIVQFFPRHILVGCIGGIGLFLIMTGFEICTGITFSWTLEYLHDIVQQKYAMIWGSGMLLAMTLKVLQRHYKQASFIPTFYVTTPLIFYAVVFIGGWSLDDLRQNGWLFHISSTEKIPFYTFWTFFDWKQADGWSILACLPTMLSLTFFGILHVPINVPALSVSTKQDTDTNKELLGHGWSNLISGLLGSCQNYLVYSNSVLYYRSGGDMALSGIFVALGTFFLMLFHSEISGLVPIPLIAALIFHLGIDLIKESLLDTLYVGMSTLEYLTVFMIVLIMGIFGFTEGILSGILVTCVLFVFVYSRRSVIRLSYSGSDIRSTVHRPYRQQLFLEAVGSQIHVLKLQGFMFFGTISQLEAYTRTLLSQTPKIRHLILDFSLITGIDYSATEAFQRLKRLCSEKMVILIFCGIKHVKEDLKKSELFQEDTNNIKAFESVNEALEWSENGLLDEYNEAKDQEGTTNDSPRHTQLVNAGSWLLQESPDLVAHKSLKSNFLLELFQDLATCLPKERPIHVDELERIINLFESCPIHNGWVLWEQGDKADEMYIVQDGELELLSLNEELTIETFLRGTLIGEVEFLSHGQHSYQLKAKRSGQVWVLKREPFQKLSLENPGLTLTLVHLLLGSSSLKRRKAVVHY